MRRFLNTEQILFPNYVCQIFIEMMITEPLSHPVQLGMTREKDWIMFGNNLSVFFSLVVGTKLDANNASQKDGSRLGVLKLLSSFEDMVFWIGPDLLSLTRAYETDPNFVRAVIGQTDAPYGTPAELLELLYWQAVAGGMSDAVWAPDTILEILRGSNRLNLDRLTPTVGRVAFIESADKLEIKALGMVAGIQKKSSSTFNLG